MPMYYFHLRNHNRITDIDGTELADVDSARGHAVAVARELKFKNNEMMGKDGRNGTWPCTTMTAWSCFHLRCPM